MITVHLARALVTSITNAAAATATTTACSTISEILCIWRLKRLVTLLKLICLFIYLLFRVNSCVCRNFDYERVNRLLRDELDEATAANKSLVAELNTLRQQCDEKELDWRKEEQV